MFKKHKKIKCFCESMFASLLHDMVYKNYNYNTTKLLFTIVKLHKIIKVCL